MFNENIPYYITLKYSTLGINNRPYKSQYNYLLDIKKNILFFKDELRTICGWSLTSHMPNLYSKNYITMLANQHNNIKRKNSYADVYLNQHYLTETEEMKILDKINDLDLINRLTDIYEIQNNVILHIAYEIAPRPSQFHTLNVSDFKFFKNKKGKKFYSINLPMSKKRKSIEIEKRMRSISGSLSKKIEKLLSLSDITIFEDSCSSSIL